MLIAAGMALGVNLSGWGATYYVSPTGKDKLDGAQTRPFATIQRAALIMEPGDTCIIHGGMYQETVRPLNSGTEGKPIVFRAYSGERVIMAGATDLTKWQPADGALWKVGGMGDMGQNNQVFLAGRQIPEARWPDANQIDPLKPQTARVDDCGKDWVICKTIPDKFPDDFFTGATIWVLAGRKWTSWTSRVRGYVAAEKKLIIDPISDQAATFHTGPGECFLSGVKNLLDHPWEWIFDGGNGLLLFPPLGVEPDNCLAYAKTRHLAFDLYKRSYIHIQGIEVQCASIRLTESSHSRLENIRVTYVSQTRGGNTDYSPEEESGIVVQGNYNVIRDCEIGYSSGNGIHLSGARNQVVNCWIHHTNSLGSFDAPIRMAGRENLISHNTIHDAGRDGILVSGTGHQIQYNHIYNTGRICHDSGILYAVNKDGESTEIHHNWLHDNLSPGLGVGVFLDRYCANYIVHHNVIWGTLQEGLRLNKIQNFTLVANNTVFGGLAEWGRPHSDDMYGVRVCNNLFTAPVASQPDIRLASNLMNIEVQDVAARDFRLKENSPAIDAGIPIPGITDGFAGKAPDCGAYETGVEPWVCGHDFSASPDPVFSRASTAWRNRVANASFEDGARRGMAGGGQDIPRWTKIGKGTAKLALSKSSLVSDPDDRTARLGRYSVVLGTDGEDGVEQKIEGLAPDTAYTASAWARLAEAPEVAVTVRDYGGEPIVKSVRSTAWERVEIQFKTGPGSTSAVICLRKPDVRGAAYGDDFGLIPTFAGN
ncbi:MAG: hypothetical protein A3K19_00935 [Lentisphaerae bacterium RIFOXYB12_FULL_65_16]|nr:MAG: hypothetical protein A3K18_18980 [Lentisphaerae bacterium RIFOXYA12_64_32]OGV85570.1 MAG: hypothetical protein A3K19_00935 [Lentisphaerae bacterium RIFOXYB12_FULL_65_16]